MSIEAIRELETLASVCPELNMANYTEDDVRHLNDWAIEMSLLVERYALSKQPAASEPVAWSEREQLRHAQAAVVMPMIGPLLDAWENSDREVMSQEPELSKQLRNINSAMEDADTHPAPSAPDDVVQGGIRNAEDELNCAEEVLDAITCEFSDGEFPVTDFNCIGDYITAVVDVFKERLAAQQPATGEPVQADSSEHLRVVASLGDALRRLSFAAQTTGGTAGPDAELQSAIGQAEQALSLGGIWQAMSATPEPVKAAPYNTTEEMRWAMKRIDPALSSEQCRALWSAAWSVAPSTHPAPSVPDAVVRDAERGRFLVGWLKRFGLLQAEFGQIGAGEKPENWWLLHAPWGIDKTRPFFGHGKTPEQAIDAAKDAT